MRTKKAPACDRAPAGVDLATARRQIRESLQVIVREWRQQHPTLLRQSAGQVTFLDDFSLRRLENGGIKSVSPYGYPFMPREADIGIGTFIDWLIPAAIMKIRMLVLAELNRLTGRKSINPLDLGPLLQDCGMLVNILIGDPEHPYDVQSLGKKLRAFLDPEVLKIALRARDTFSSLALYNTIAANRESWLALEAQSPSLMPLVSYACRKKQIHFDQNAFRSLKQYARRHGLTETGWKALCNFPVEHVHHLLQYSLEDCFRAASHFGETGLLPPISLIERHVADCQRRRVPIGAIPAWFDQAAIRELQRLQKEQFLPASSFVNGLYAFALDWLADYLAGGGRPDAHQKKAGWRWIQRQSEAWHDEQVRKQVTNNYAWGSALGGYEDNGYDVVPLTTSVDLAVEGAQMHHCVGAYADVCHAGRSRIFSIRQNGKSLATAELVQLSCGWRLNQNRGPYNRPPSPDIMAVAQRLELRYNAAIQASLTVPGSDCISPVERDPGPQHID